MPVHDPTGDRRRDLAALLEFGVGPFGFLPATITEQDRALAGKTTRCGACGRYGCGESCTIPRCPRCNAPLEAVLHTAPGYAGLEHHRCPSCGWTGEP